MADQDEDNNSAAGVLEALPLDQLKDAAQQVLTALAERAAGSITDKVEDMTDRLTESANNGGAGLMAAVTGGKKLAEGESPIKAGLSAGVAGLKDKASEALGTGGKKGGKKGKSKVVNIIEHNDIGLPRRVVYNQWTEFESFPDMTKKVLSVDKASDEKVNWQAQILWSKRSWEATIVEMVPDEHIIWTSTGAKGTVDGIVTFHDLTPDMTRVLLVLEYYPSGFFEKTGYIWRAQGRRVRADFKFIKRYMMTKTILAQDEVEGWRGEIRDREVVKTHEEALQEEKESEAQEEESREPGDEGDEYRDSGEGSEADERPEEESDEYEGEEDDYDEDDYGEDEYYGEGGEDADYGENGDEDEHNGQPYEDEYEEEDEEELAAEVQPRRSKRERSRATRER